MVNLSDLQPLIFGLPSSLFPPALYRRWAIIQPTWDITPIFLVYPNCDLPIGEAKDGELVNRYIPEVCNDLKAAVKFIDEMID